MEFTLIALSAVCFLALLALDARRRERATWREWEILLTPKGERTYGDLSRHVRDNAVLVDVTLARADELRAVGARGEAGRVLQVGSEMLARFTSMMTQLLSQMVRYSRMTFALAGVTPLPVAEFRTPPLRWRAQLVNLVQPFLVTAGERYRLRVVVLRGGFRLLHGVVERAVGRLRRRADTEANDWAGVTAARVDVALLTEESLHSLRALLSALGARPRAKAALLAEEPRT
jgi:hypothetical protein